MKLFTKYGARPNEVRRAKREFYARLALVGFVLLFFAVMILITRLSPRLGKEAASEIPTAVNTGDPLSNPALIRMREQVRDLEQQFNNQLDESSVSLENLGILEQAIDMQKQVIRYRGSEMAPLQDIERLEAMQSTYDEYMGDFLRAQSNRLEREANTAWELGRSNEALEKLTTATNLQNQINSDFPRSSARNTSRLRQMETLLLTWTTRPFATEVDQLKDKASIFVRTENYDEALQLVDEAIRKQIDLNQNFRESRYASMYRVRELEDLRKNIGLTRDVTQVRRIQAEARETLRAGEPRKTLDRLEEAEALLLRIEATYPQDRSQFADLQREIQNFKDTAAGTEAFDQLQKIEADIVQGLRQKNLAPLRNLISDWHRLALDFRRRYPRSEQAQNLEMDRIEYLHRLRDHIPSILDVVYSGLIAVPGHPNQHLFQSEVSQALYTRLVDENPSQNQNPQLPVESVTWEEASHFCRLMSWLLAYPVDLPRRELLIDAIGVVSRDQPSDRFWSFENTERETRPVGSSSSNQFGFHDLLGNVAEWLGASGTEVPERVVAFGGSARDSRTRLVSIPEEPRGPRERNRFVGFRFKVDLSATGDPQ